MRRVARRWGLARKRLDALHALSFGLQRLEGPADPVQALVDALEAAFGFEYGAILLRDEATGRLVPRALASRGLSAAALESDKAHVAARTDLPGKGITGWVAEAGESARIGDVRADRRYQAVREGVRSELCVPIRIRGRVAGVIHTETSRRNAFSRADQRVLEVLAGHAALALELERWRTAAGPGWQRDERIATACAYCRRLRSTQGEWLGVEPFLERETGIAVSHGVCPACFEALFPE